MSKVTESKSLRTVSRVVAMGSAAATLGILFLCLPAAHAGAIPKGWEATNMKPVGYSDLEGRGGAFKMAIRHVNDRWYLYLGHLWHRGWSIVDVTNVENPKFVWERIRIRNWARFLRSFVRRFDANKSH